MQKDGKLKVMTKEEKKMHTNERIRRVKITRGDSLRMFRFDRPQRMANKYSYNEPRSARG